MMNELELTSQDVADWFVAVRSGFGNAVYTVNGKNIAMSDVAAYVRKLESRVMRLATKLADQL